jgi:membrane protein YqaA with SNARE-associated domain
VTKRQLTLARIIGLLVVVGISIFIFSIRDRASQLAIYGYPGIFILAFLAYATVFLPAPGVAVIFTMGAVFNPVGVALAAGAGAALGELSGYLAGFSGQAIVERANIYNQLTRWMKSNGPLTILLLSAFPNPFFDIVGVIAGALRVRLVVFLFWCWIGETLKMLFFALAGSGILN